jgi:hypothetical protein
MRSAQAILQASAVFAVLLGPSTTSSYSASLPEITTVGAGGDVCRQWTQAIKEPSARYQYRQWLFGFVSGFNWRDASKQINPQDSTALLAWVDEFCKVNPEAPVYVAAGNLARQMTKAPAASDKKR